MEPKHLPQARADRLIAMARMVLAMFTLLAVWLDPELSSGRFHHWWQSVAVVFALYAILLGAASTRALFTDRSRLFIHIFDFLLYAALIELTQAPAVFFVFWIFCGMLRFGTRGAIVTASIALLTTLALIIWQDSMRQQRPAFLVLRFASLVTVSLLLVSFAAYEGRLRSELSKLASWPQTHATSREALANDALRAARDLLNASVAILLWDEPEEPWVWYATSRDGTFAMAREGPEFGSSLVAEEAGESTFLCHWLPEEIVLRDDGSGPRPIAQCPITLQTRERLNLGTAAVSSPVRGDLVDGRVIFGFTRAVTIDDMPLTEIVSRLVAARLDHGAAAERMRDAAVGQERIRLARDLHDGILQSLTGAALQLESVLRMIGSDDETARARVRNVQQVIEADQRELRSFITQLRPQPAVPRSVSLLARLQSLATRFERQWNVTMNVEVVPPSPPLPDSLAGEIYNIVNEAASNAAKHAGGDQIDVRIEAVDGEVQVTVQDNGRGFPFHGTYDLATLDDLKRGPVTLKERVASLNGDLRLQSSPDGTRLDITLAL